MIGYMARREFEEVRKDAAYLRTMLEKKTKEIRYVRRLAQHVLDQRTDVEGFFLESLDRVKREIAHSRSKRAKSAKRDVAADLRVGEFAGQSLKDCRGGYLRQQVVLRRKRLLRTLLPPGQRHRAASTFTTFLGSRKRGC